MAKQSRKTAKIWTIYITEKMKKNFHIALQREIWGFVKEAIKNRPELHEIKKGDILVFFGPTVNSKDGKSIFARMKGTFSTFYKHIKKENYEIENVSVLKIKKELWNEEEHPSGPNGTYMTIWPDETQQNKKYPHRIQFKELIIKSSKIKLKKLNQSTINFLRKSMQGVSISEMSFPDFVELTRNLTLEFIGSRMRV